MEFRPLPKGDDLLQGYERPEMMAIGDSIFNGVRSLSIDSQLASFSPPALIATGLDIPFQIPDYPYPILVDLEQEIRDGVDLDRLYKHVVQNVDLWLGHQGRWSDIPFFDNIAIGGARYENLHTDTSGYFKWRANQLAAKLRTSKQPDWTLLGDLHYAINAAFLLNPSGDPDLDDLTPLEQVASRRPKRLIINIGNNHGLYMIGITGSGDRRFVEEMRMIPEYAERLAADLQQHCSDVGTVYFNLLIRPRLLGNLAPRTDNELWNPPGCDKYYKKYVGRIGGMNGISARHMKSLDAEVKKINEKTMDRMQKAVGKKIKLVFIDPGEAATKHDRKHGCEKKKDRIFVDRKGTPNRLSNFPFSSNIAGFRHGGLFGLDNMHPTVPGYALLANAVGSAISKTEGLQYDQIGWQHAFDNDTLLQEPPRNWDRLMLLVSLLVALGFFKFGEGA